MVSNLFFDGVTEKTGDTRIQSGEYKISSPTSSTKIFRFYAITF